MKRSAHLLLLILWLPLATALAAPKAELWPLWQARAAQASLQPDYSRWQLFLDRYLQPVANGVTRVAYGAVSAADRTTLNGQIDALQQTAVSRLTATQQKAFWINLYNAGTVQVILDHYPVKSIRDIDISPGWFNDGPWGKKLYQIEGQAVSLNDIEHRILRPIWQDNRVHYALNCASIGCPNLQLQAFTATNTEALLEQAARSYINHPRGASVVDGKLLVSSIYTWFQEDFGDSDSGVIQHLRRYAAAPLLAQLKGIERIDDDRYDWSINGHVK